MEEIGDKLNLDRVGKLRVDVQGICLYDQEGSQ